MCVLRQLHSHLLELNFRVLSSLLAFIFLYAVKLTDFFLFTLYVYLKCEIFVWILFRKQPKLDKLLEKVGVKKVNRSIQNALLLKTNARVS